MLFIRNKVSNLWLTLTSECSTETRFSHWPDRTETNIYIHLPTLANTHIKWKLTAREITFSVAVLPVLAKSYSSNWLNNLQNTIRNVKISSVSAIRLVKVESYGWVASTLTIKSKLIQMSFKEVISFFHSIEKSKNLPFNFFFWQICKSHSSISS